MIWPARQRATRLGSYGHGSFDARSYGSSNRGVPSKGSRVRVSGNVTPGEIIKLPGVRQIRTFFVLKEILSTTALPV